MRHPARAFWVVVAFWAIVAASAFIGWKSRPNVQAYELHGFKMPPGQGSTDPALLPWQAHGNLMLDFTIVSIEAGDGPDIAWALPLNTDGIVTACFITLGPGYFEFDVEAREHVLTHEYGHCLGIHHSEEPSLMKNSLLFPFSADDAAAIAELYPYPHRLTIPSVGRN